MLRDYRLFLEDIRDCCQKVLRYTAGMTQTQWQTDELTYDATLRNLEIIGEATVHLSPEIRKRHPGVDWRKIRAFRNVVAHEYFGVNNDIVWDIIQNRVPELLVQIEQVIAVEARSDKRA